MALVQIFLRVGLTSEVAFEAIAFGFLDIANIVLNFGKTVVELTFLIEAWLCVLIIAFKVTYEATFVLTKPPQAGCFPSLISVFTSVLIWLDSTLVETEVTARFVPAA